MRQWWSQRLQCMMFPFCQNDEKRVQNQFETRGDQNPPKHTRTLPQSRPALAPPRHGPALTPPRHGHALTPPRPDTAALPAPSATIKAFYIIIHICISSVYPNTVVITYFVFWIFQNLCELFTDQKSQPTLITHHSKRLGFMTTLSNEFPSKLVIFLSPLPHQHDFEQLP